MPTFAEQSAALKKQIAARKAAKNTPAAKAESAARIKSTEDHLKGTKARTGSKNTPKSPTKSPSGSTRGAAKDALRRELGIKTRKMNQTTDSNN